MSDEKMSPKARLGEPLFLVLVMLWLAREAASCSARERAREIVPRRPIARVLPAVGSVLAGVALAALLLGPGCASTPRVDKLRAAIDLNNAVVADLDKAKAALRQAAADDFARRADACEPLAAGARESCLVQAAVATKRAFAAETTRLTALVLAEETVADALAAAKACRKDKLDCEAEHLQRAQAPLGEVRAGLASGGADAGAEGGTADGGTRP